MDPSGPDWTKEKDDLGDTATIAIAIHPYDQICTLFFYVVMDTGHCPFKGVPSTENCVYVYRDDDADEEICRTLNKVRSSNVLYL